MLTSFDKFVDLEIMTGDDEPFLLPLQKTKETVQFSSTFQISTTYIQLSTLLRMIQKEIILVRIRQTKTYFEVRA